MKLQLVGAYLPRLDSVGVARYVEEDQRRSVNITVPSLQAQGFLADLSQDEIQARAVETAEEMLTALQQVALFEISVSDSGGEFELSELSADAWEPAYLSPDGELLLEDLGLSEATAKEFRVAFYVHEWQQGDKLRLGRGNVAVPAFTAVPERLWRLAPYALLD